MIEDSVRIRLNDMHNYASKAVRILAHRSAENLATEEVYALAVVHAVQIVGEAARKVPDDVRATAPSVAWRASVAMRNILVHDYGDIDFDILVATVRNDFPPLIAELERLLEQDP